MLILVAVTIQVATNGNLFKHAGNAVKETKNAVLQENYIGEGRIQVGGERYNAIEDYVATKTVDEGGSSLTATTPLNKADKVYFASAPDEIFYVLFDSDASTPTVKIISQFNVNTETNTQATDTTTYQVAFNSTANSNYAGSSIEGYVNNYVSNKLEITINQEAGEQKGLLSKEDLETLNGTGTLSSGAQLTGTPTWVKNTNFWLGTKHSSYSYIVWTAISGLCIEYDVRTAYVGVRPVLVVNKTRLSKVPSSNQ